MKRNTLEAYAQKARRDFIAAVTARAGSYGLTAKSVEPLVEEGDVVRVGAHAFPRTVVEPRKRLEEQIQRDGFGQVMEAMAYTWFNRFAAIRYMELHGYLGHGYRVLSHPDGQPSPEILEHAADVDLPGLDREKAVELKLDGSQDEELYRLLLKAQCNALHQAMAFLFEPIGDETELLLPANLLHTDSLIHQMVEGIDESAWEQIEIIGWLYQFYISEKKGQVIGKVVASEDIPAATQLFTPNWIVRYLVQNSLGAQWLATYPHSQLKAEMDYYIEPAEQTDEVTAQLAAITPSTLNPEALTLIDPACGSGHILVEAYDLFKAIYLERGYQKRDVVRLILEKNLFGLDIDGRAAQLTGFAMMMKARGDDRRVFERGVELNVMALVDSKGFDAERLAQGVDLAEYGFQLGDLTELKRLFEHATTFGSLIQVPKGLAAKLPALKQLSEAPVPDLFESGALKWLRLLVRQAEMLTAQYDAVVANPPYMGSKGMNALVKKFGKDQFPDAKSDLFACFIERGYTLAKEAGYDAMVTMQSWMFLSSFEKMRERMLQEKTIGTMAHLGARAFGSISGEVVQTTACVLQNRSPQGYKPVFFRLLDGGEVEKSTALANGEKRFDTTAQDEFKKIPGSPVAYWASTAQVNAFAQGTQLSRVAQPRSGMSTGNATDCILYWWEPNVDHIGFYQCKRTSHKRFYPHNKAGGDRRWFGYTYYVLKYGDDDLRDMGQSAGFRHDNRDFYFRPSISWGKITSSRFSARAYPAGFVFDNAAVSLFSQRGQKLLGLLNSAVFRQLVGFLSPTLNFSVGDVSRAPVPREEPSTQAGEELLSIHADDWDSYERSHGFGCALLLKGTARPERVEGSFNALRTSVRTLLERVRVLEARNNTVFSNAFALTKESHSEVPIGDVTLTVNPYYRYGGNLTDEERWVRFRQDTMKELVSFAIGCMMGRYSLDKPGLIYAHSEGAGFDATCYTTLPADSDGIVPLTDGQWFDDDAVHRIVEFISVAWDAAHLEDNLAFLANNLSPKKNESSREILRGYLCDSFFKDHLKIYRKRPIYWLFSSGKQKAFQCLVYLHRYNEGTLARMRTEYVIPLQGMMASRVLRLKDDIAANTSTAHDKRLEKERATLVKQESELREFDEKLRHYADQRISLNLDDGVKVNYGKFGDLLAEVKAVTGAKPD